MKNNLFTLPNIVTLANMACGCGAVVMAFDGRLDAVFWLVVAAAVFDFLDGMTARLTGQYSEIGKQLDSLADVVSFGVAPSAALFSIYAFAAEMWRGAPGGLYGLLGWAVFAVALFSALRLAKFNVDETQSEEFEGLPTPAAGLAIASLGWMVQAGALEMPREAVLVLVALVSWLLVCRIRMFSLKFKSLAWRGNGLRYTFLGLSVVLIATLGIGGVAACIALYVVMSAVRGVVCRRAKNPNKL